MVKRLKPVQIIGPAEPVLTLAEAKVFLRVSANVSEHDDQIEAHIAAATNELDGWSGLLGRCLVSQTWRADFDSFPADVLTLPFGDVRTVTVAYSDQDGVDQTLSSLVYRMATTGGRSALYLRSGYSWPSVEADRPDAVRVTMICGYGDASAVPPGLVAGVKLMVKGLFDGIDYRDAVEALAQKYRLAP